MFRVIAGLLLGPSSAAHAFCGAYVGSDPGGVTNQTSRMVVVRQGDRTVLTMANDFIGPYQDFGLLIPVPHDFDLTGFATVEPEALDRMDEYSAPRLVSFTCAQVSTTDVTYRESSGKGRTPSGGCSGGASTAPPTEPITDTDTAVASEGTVTEGPVRVEVEARESIGAYQVTILSGGSAGLTTWLNENGFAATSEQADRLGETLNGGKLVALRVDLGEPLAGGWLPPVQISYTSSAWTLPIRLGAASSTGEQDLLLYVVNEFEKGAAAISNYDEFAVADGCMTAGADFYAPVFDQALDEVGVEGEASWTTEYAWPGGMCDPCPPSGQLDSELLATLGFDGDDSYVTRLHLRYRPEQIDEDLALYHSGLTGFEQLRYVESNSDFANDYPYCLSGWQTDGAVSCRERFSGSERIEIEDESAEHEADDGGTGGCLCALAPAAPPAVWVFFGVTAGLTRRKR